MGAPVFELIEPRSPPVYNGGIRSSWCSVRGKPSMWVVQSAHWIDCGIVVFNSSAQIKFSHWPLTPLWGGNTNETCVGSWKPQNVMGKLWMICTYLKERYAYIQS